MRYNIISYKQSEINTQKRHYNACKTNRRTGRLPRDKSYKQEKDKVCIIMIMITVRLSVCLKSLTNKKNKSTTDHRYVEYPGKPTQRLRDNLYTTERIMSKSTTTTVFHQVL